MSPTTTISKPDSANREIVSNSGAMSARGFFDRIEFTPRALLVAAIGLELFLLAILTVSAPLTLLRGSKSYARLAEEILRTGTLSSTYRPPAYPVLIAAIDWSFGVFSGYALFAAHCALAVGSMLMIYFIADRVSGSRRAAFIALGLCLTHVLLQVELVTERETALYIFLELAAFFVWTRYPHRDRAFAAIGIIAGLAHLTRPNGMFLWAAIIGSYALLSLKSDSKRTTKHVAIALAGFLAVCLPWIETIHASTGQWSLNSSTSGGMNLWKGNNRYTRHVLPWLEVDELEAQARVVLGDDDLTSDDANRKFQALARDHVMRHPLTSLIFTVKKAALFLAPIPIPWGTGVIQENSDEILIDDFRPRKGWYVFVLHTCVMYAGLVGFLAHRRRVLGAENKYFYAAFGLLLLFSVVIQAVTFPETRLRLPLDPLFAICAAVGFDRRFRRRRAPAS